MVMPRLGGETSPLPVLDGWAAAHGQHLAQPVLQGVGLAGDGGQQLAGLFRGHTLAWALGRGLARPGLLGLVAGLRLRLALALALLSLLVGLLVLLRLTLGVWLLLAVLGLLGLAALLAVL